jgi:hypothetical protein
MRYEGSVIGKGLSRSARCAGLTKFAQADSSSSYNVTTTALSGTGTTITVQPDRIGSTLIVSPRRGIYLVTFQCIERALSVPSYCHGGFRLERLLSSLFSYVTSCDLSGYS